MAEDHCRVWLYSLFTDKPGDFVKKPMRECTGKEICMEWLYHIGVPESEIEELATNSANTVPVMKPYINTFIMPRAYGDRPKVVPDASNKITILCPNGAKIMRAVEAHLFCQKSSRFFDSFAGNCVPCPCGLVKHYAQ